MHMSLHVIMLLMGGNLANDAEQIVLMHPIIRSSAIKISRLCVKSESSL